MRTVQITDRERRVAELTRKISTVARELAEVALSADLAAARGDIDVLYDSSETALELARRWSAAYRALLVARTSSGRVSEYSSL